MSVLFDEDPDVARALEMEDQRQRDCIVLIASENYASKAVLEPGASVISNKYAEGYPGRRYYGGCEYSDIVESLAIDRVKELFGAQHANVQPHSGAQANMAAYFAVLEPGDTVLGMQLDHGGHLTHGANVNFSGKVYNFIPYGLDEKTETIDYDEVERLAKEHKPKLLVAGCSAYPRVLDFARFKAIADNVGALLMVDMAHIAGLIAGGAHPSPLPYANIVTSTTQKSLRGPRGGFILCDADLARKVDFAVIPFTQGGPLMQAIAGKAVCFREAMQPSFREYQQRIVENAQHMAEAFKRHGFRLVSDGTDTHLMLVDLRTKGVTGKVAEKSLEKAGITVNKNTIPFDPEKPFIASGIRIGTPALTTRGMGATEIDKVVALIDRALADPENEQNLELVKKDIEELCVAFPLVVGEDRPA